VSANGGFIDEGGSTDSLQYVIALGVLGWLVGVVGPLWHQCCVSTYL
jgi:hypothetical protein